MHCGPRRRHPVVRHGCGEPPFRRGGLRPGRRALSRGQATRSVRRGRRAARARRHLLDDGRGRAVPLPQAAARPSPAYDGHAAAAAAAAAGPSGRRYARLCVPAVRAALPEDDATLHDERRARRRAPTALALAPVFSSRRGAGCAGSDVERLLITSSDFARTSRPRLEPPCTGGRRTTTVPA